jgi:hypothetical protein
MLEIQGQAFLESVDDWLTAHQVEGDSETDAIRLGVGVYHIEESSARARLK